MKKTYYFLTLSAVILILATACSAAQAAPLAQAEDPQPEEVVRRITVNGNGRVTATPDIARVLIGVQTEAEDAATAVAENNELTQSVIDTLLDFGVEEEDIQTSNFSVFPRQERDPDGNLTEVSYVVSNTVNVTVRNLDDLGQLLDAVVVSGANDISGIQFDLADRSAVTAQALDAAYQDAQKKAEILAESASVTLGQVISIESFSSPPIVPIQRASVDFALEAAEVPISPGQVEIFVDVTAIYEIGS